MRNKEKRNIFLSKLILTFLILVLVVPFLIGVLNLISTTASGSLCPEYADWEWNSGLGQWWCVADPVYFECCYGSIWPPDYP